MKKLFLKFNSQLQPISTPTITLTLGSTAELIVLLPMVPGSLWLSWITPGNVRLAERGFIRKPSEDIEGLNAYSTKLYPGMTFGVIRDIGEAVFSIRADNQQSNKIRVAVQNTIIPETTEIIPGVADDILNGINDLANVVDKNEKTAQDHYGDFNNPHKVSAEQINTYVKDVIDLKDAGVLKDAKEYTDHVLKGYYTKAQIDVIQLYLQEQLDKHEIRITAIEKQLASAALKTPVDDITITYRDNKLTVKKEFSDTKLDVVDFEAHEDEMNLKFDVMTNDIQEIDQEIHDTVELAEKNKTDIAGLKTQVSGIDEEIVNIKNDQSSLEGNVATNKTAIANEKQRNDAQDRNIADLDTRVKTNKSSIDSHSSEITSLKNKNISTDESIAEIKNELGNHDGSIANLVAKDSAQDLLINKNTSDISENKIAIGKNTADVAVLKSNVETRATKQELNALKDTVDTKASEVAVDNQMKDKLDKRPDGTNELVVNGKINDTYLSPHLINETYVVDSETAMLALDADVGDMAIRTDIEKTFILQNEPANELSNWIELLVGAVGVSSVNELTGEVNLGIDNIPGLRQAINLKLDAITFEREIAKYVKTEDLTNITADLNLAIKALQDNKVDKVAGKGLSTNDFSTAEKNKLSAIEAGAQKNPYTKVELDNKFNTKVDKVAGKGLSENDFTNAIKTKVDGVEVGAQKNPYTKAELDSKYDAKVDKITGKGLSTFDFDVSFRNKLNGIQAGAQKNPYSKEELDKFIDDKVDKEVGKTLTTNDFSNAAKAKLDGVEVGAQKNPNFKTINGEVITGTGNIVVATELPDGLATEEWVGTNYVSNADVSNDPIAHRLVKRDATGQMYAKDAVLDTQVPNLGQVSDIVNTTVKDLEESIDIKKYMTLDTEQTVSGYKKFTNGVQAYTVATRGRGESLESALPRKDGYGNKHYQVVGGQTPNKGTLPDGFLETYLWDTANRYDFRILYPNSVNSRIQYQMSGAAGNWSNAATREIATITDLNEYLKKDSGAIYIRENLGDITNSNQLPTNGGYYRYSNNQSIIPKVGNDGLVIVEKGRGDVVSQRVVGNYNNVMVYRTGSNNPSSSFYINNRNWIIPATTTDLANKVDKKNGWGLSTNDYSTTEKNKLSSIQIGAQKNLDIYGQLQERSYYSIRNYDFIVERNNQIGATCTTYIAAVRMLEDDNVPTGDITISGSTRRQVRAGDIVVVDIDSMKIMISGEIFTMVRNETQFRSENGLILAPLTSYEY